MANLPALTPTNFAEALTFSEMLSKSSMVPREYQRQPANILLAVQWGAELGLGPLQAINSIAIINGKPAVYGDAMLALVRGSGLCEDIIESIAGSGDEITALCTAKRRGATPVTGRFSVADAKRAGLWNKSGPWQQYPTRMLAMRARGFALRDAFADVLRGVISAEEAAEEAADTPREARDITPQASPALTDALDAFAATDTDEPEKATQQAPESAAEAEINRGSDHITDHAGGARLEGEDENELLYTARAEALRGEASFREWYLRQLDDEAREQLRPHIKELQGAARAASRE